MSQQEIDVGTVANDGTGDPLRDAFIKINEMMEELYELRAQLGTSPAVAGDVLVFDGNSPGVFQARALLLEELGDVDNTSSPGPADGDVLTYSADSPSGWYPAAPPGDVVGPASSVAGHVALFDGLTGKLLKDSGLATLANGANLVLAAAPAVNAVGFLGAPQIADQDDYTLALADSGGHYYHVSGTPHTLTIPANGSIAFPIGTVIGIVNENGAGAITLTITTDTLRWGSSTGSRTIAANGSATLLKVAAAVWRLTGDGIT